MKYKKLNENIILEEPKPKSLIFLYNTYLGRLILKIITLPTISKIVGNLLNLKISNILSKKYIKKYNINLQEFEKQNFNSFNHFFTRKLKSLNTTSKDTDFIATADSKLTCFDISDDLILNVKNTKYSITELLQDENLAKDFHGGQCLVFRLAPNDYHRYIFIDNGHQEKYKKIKGKLHTVNPIVYDKYKVFSENSREISILHTEHFGKIIQIEVGALCVGKISNYNKLKFNKYEEKGFFEFGGSTIIQLIPKNKIILNHEIIENSKNNIETKIKIGDIIGNVSGDGDF